MGAKSVYKDNLRRQLVREETEEAASLFLANQIKSDGKRDVGFQQYAKNNQRQHLESDTIERLKQAGEDFKTTKEASNIETLIAQFVRQCKSAETTFENIAAELFGKGKIDWKDITAVLYLAYKVYAMFRKSPEKIIAMCVIFMCTKSMDWLINQGGWNGFKAFVADHSVEIAIGLSVATVGALIGGFTLAYLLGAEDKNKKK